MSKLTFSAFQLIIDEKAPSIGEFLEYKEEQYDTKDNIYRITTQKINNTYYWIYMEYGGELPYGEKVYDKEKSEILNNPRTKSQAELNKQLFCLYDFEQHAFYVSDGRKKGFLEEYLKYKLSKDIVIKRFFKSPEQFLEYVKTIENISFTSKHNLFSINNDIFEDPKDIFGLGQPENFKMDIEYNGRTVTKNFKTKFFDLLSKKDNSEIQSLVCIGKDDNKVEAIFDISSFTQTVPLSLKKDKLGRYEQSVVQKNLLNILNGQQNV
ncbi:hypothetical protein [Sulfurovum sp.]|uniref:hypothetical protein n=1 Tax=Sulfurovum sp. TaxID=1969726 RepID=UPI002A364A18|nr:hypothetical protein [Sulfurovum sp.]MDY0403187.1 hypothetical protein [Sulfurovum sp.]